MRGWQIMLYLMLSHSLLQLSRYMYWVLSIFKLSDVKKKKSY